VVFSPEIQEQVNVIPHLQVLLDYMENKTQIEKKVGDWFDALKKRADELGIDRKQKGWPKVPWLLGRFFRDEQALLAAVGLLGHYQEPKKEDGRWVTITKRDREEADAQDSGSGGASAGASGGNPNPGKDFGNDDAPEEDEEKIIERLEQRR
jgi:hypothetical protein